DGHDTRVPRALLVGRAPWRRGAGDLLALRRRHVDRRLHLRVHHLINPIGFVSPIHSLGEELLSAHMAQHLLIADLAAPLLLAGVRNPVLMFYLPKTVLRTLARSGWPRRAFRWLRQPLV